MTVEEAIQQLQEEIKKRGKLSVGNVLDSILGVAKANTADLQDMLNKLLQKKGVLSQSDEAAVNELLKKQSEADKERKRIRVRNTILTISAFLGTGVLIYWQIKKRKK
jgi:hypothetical protein